MKDTPRGVRQDIRSAHSGHQNGIMTSGSGITNEQPTQQQVGDSKFMYSQGKVVSGSRHSVEVPTPEVLDGETLGITKV